MSGWTFRKLFWITTLLQARRMRAQLVGLWWNGGVGMIKPQGAAFGSVCAMLHGGGREACARCVWL
jgi:hypothetical protein